MQQQQDRERVMERVMVTLTASQVAKLDAVCRETGASRSQTVAIALYEWLSRVAGAAETPGDGQRTTVAM